MSPLVEASAVALGQALAAWCATYLAHSALLFAAAWAAVRVLRPGRDSQERLWRAALFGAPLTASARVALTLASGEPEPALADALAARPALAGLVVLLWTAVVLASTLAVARELLRTLRHRPPLEDAAMAAEASELGARLGLRHPIRLTRAEAASPAALGTREVCLPDESRRRLAPAQLRAVLAHELAHHARRDPLWRLAADTLCAAFFFQPLNRFSRARLRDLGERGADAIAIRLTSDRRALAEALACLAGAGSKRGAIATFAERPSRLVRRVEAILRPEPTSTTGRTLPRLGVPLVLLALAGFGPAVPASPEAAANHLPWLAPSSEEPGPRMLELRQNEREIQRRVREVRRRPARTLRRVF